jgi:hypothetical protein
MQANEGKTASVSAFSELCIEAAQRGEVSRALVSIQSFVYRAALSRESALGQVFSSRTLDDACQAIGALDPVVVSPERRGVVYIVTELQLTGGHTRVVSDLIMADDATARSGEPVTVLVTDVVAQHNPAAAALLLELGAQVETPPPGDHGARLTWLKGRLSALSPRTTRLVLHPFDSVALAAAQPGLTGELVFLHNADHNLALGVTLAHSLHVDFHAKGFYNCRERQGVRDNVLWPLTATDLGPRSPIYAGGPIRTCTCGGAEKFEPQFKRDLAPYPLRYSELAPLIPHATGGVHVHIGPLSDEALRVIGEGLDRLGVARKRFVHVPSVPSLWEALKTLEIDLYVSSFPLGGGRATVEALGAGLPICVHSNYRSIMLTPENEIYQGALIWRTPEDLVRCLTNLTTDDLSRHARAARGYYESHHHPSRLQAALAGDHPLPLRPGHTEDWLQAYLDQSGPVDWPATALGGSAS